MGDGLKQQILDPSLSSGDALLPPQPLLSFSHSAVRVSLFMKFIANAPYLQTSSQFSSFLFHLVWSLLRSFTPGNSLSAPARCDSFQSNARRSRFVFGRLYAIVTIIQRDRFKLPSLPLLQVPVFIMSKSLPLLRSTYILSPQLLLPSWRTYYLERYMPPNHCHHYLPFTSRRHCSCCPWFQQNRTLLLSLAFIYVLSPFHPPLLFPVFHFALLYPCIHRLCLSFFIFSLQ